MIPEHPGETAAIGLALAGAAAIALAALPLLPWMGVPVLLGGLVLWNRLRDRILPSFRAPWLLVVVGAGLGAADVVGVGAYALAASLVVGFLLALAQAADRRMASR
jgi:hypothetical protein